MYFFQQTYRVAVLSLMAACASRSGAAQDTPVADVAANYSHLAVVNGSGATADGGGGSGTLNLNHWFGAVGDFALYHSSLVGPGLSAGTYTFGPRFSYRHWHRLTPFAQALFGGVRYANNGLAFGAGGGADIALDPSERFAVRPQVEYFGFRANGSVINTVRVSFSLVLRIGRR